MKWVVGGILVAGGLAWGALVWAAAGMDGNRVPFHAIAWDYVPAVAAIAIGALVMVFA